MSGFLRLAIRQHKASLLIIAFVLLAGLIARGSMTIESFPSVKTPFVIIKVVHQGISPEDGSRLLIKPLEQELKTLEDVVEITATARENMAYAVVEFDTNVDIDTAVRNTREVVDRAKAEFPDNTEEPVVEEAVAQSALVVVVSFSSDTASERELFQLAKSFQQDFEGISDVLSVKLKGAREEVAEIYIDPARLEYFGISANELLSTVQQNNLLIPAGDLDAGYGNFGVKVPGLIEDIDDIRKLPVKSSPEGVITLEQVADVRRTFKDAEGFGRVNGKPTLALEINKRLKANTVDTVQAVRQMVADKQDRIPANITVEFVLDISEFTQNTVDELTGNIIAAMALVMVLVVASLGLRSGILVGFGIPFSLLGAFIVVYLLGFSINFMVIFGLLLSLGMLIDGALVVVEYAERKMQDGLSPIEAYLGSVQRMSVPIIASTLTTLAAFLPLAFWPGVTGEFMSYLPKTVFSVLIWSLIFSLVVVPIVGSMFMSDKHRRRAEKRSAEEAEDAVEFSAIRKVYLGGLNRCLNSPVKASALMVFLLVSIFWCYGKFGPGIEFFADSEDVMATVSIRAQGNLTVEEKLAMAKQVENKLAQVDEMVSYYVSTGGFGFMTGGSAARDQIAPVLIEILHPTQRDKSMNEVLDEIRTLTAEIPGIIVQVDKIQGGPPIGKDIQLELTSEDRPLLHQTARRARQFFDGVEGLRDVEDTLSLPGIEWQFIVDKPSAAMLGINVAQVGQVIQMVTEGVYLGEYRPDDADEEVEIRLRYPAKDRSIEALRHLRVSTPNGSVPVSSFVTIEPKPRVDVVQRIDGVEVINVSAYTEEGVFVADKVAEISQWLESEGIDQQLDYRFRGASEEVDESQAFLSLAFGLALFLMLIILVAQFNSFYQALLIISAVVMSAAGVMLGLIITQVPFGMIMNGVGIVALAGIVVNNNIVLIDTFNRLEAAHPDWNIAKRAMHAAKLRFRPVMLTTLTTVIGLLPLANGASIDLINRNILIDGIVASFWSPMALTIVNGLAFSTVLTLLFTPTMLVLPSVLKSALSNSTLLNRGSR